ncbi:hypothetical protein AMJ80_10870 [bacterium SM23_31]|nr:MAG: hypothetical protein AMJ80_10870 [bacterium SM23_31]
MSYLLLWLNFRQINETKLIKKISQSRREAASFPPQSGRFVVGTASQRGKVRKIFLHVLTI